MYKIQLIVQYSSMFLTLKAETRYLFEKFKEKTSGLIKSLEQTSKATQITDARSQNGYVRVHPFMTSTKND